MVDDFTLYKSSIMKLAAERGICQLVTCFPFNFFAAAFAGALVTTLLALPLWRKWCLRTNLVDDPGHRKIHNTPVPLAGGLAVLTGILLPLCRRRDFAQARHRQNFLRRIDHPRP